MSSSLANDVKPKLRECLRERMGWDTPIGMRIPSILR